MLYVVKEYVRFLLCNYIEILVKNRPILDSTTEPQGSCYKIVNVCTHLWHFCIDLLLLLECMHNNCVTRLLALFYVIMFATT